jgi:hypothetical protein
MSNNEIRPSPARMPSIAAKPADRPPRMAYRRSKRVSAPGERIITREAGTKAARTAKSTTTPPLGAGTV